jgi:hypothetical protein
MPDHEGHPADYTGLHAFLFVDHVEPGTNPEEVVRRLIAKGMPPIMYASTVVGDYQVFAHARVTKLAELQDLIETTIWEAGARCSWSIESKISTLGVKRRSPGLIALTRLTMQHGSENAARKKLVTPPLSAGFVGASKITGAHGIVLQMTGSSIDDAEENIRNALRDVEGVIGMSTAFIDGDRTQERYGDIPLNAMPPEDEGS